MTADANPKYRHSLPQLNGNLYLSDGGLETTLIFHEGWELPMFASFPLIQTAEGRAALATYYERYLDMARRHGTGFILEAPIWRATPDWGAKLGYDLDSLAALNRRCMELMHALRRAHDSPQRPVVVSGCIGPRGDGYAAGEALSAAEQRDYHAWQVGVLKDAGADMVSAFTMTSISEGLGVALAAKDAGIPSVISFTLETDGRLPSGETLPEAIATVDAATGSAPAYYMINCAHPDHFDGVLTAGEGWLTRLRGLRANASRRSHEELDNSPDLDAGDPEELGALHGAIRSRLPHVNVLGGCCGTDHRHVECIGAACRKAA